MKSGMSKTLHYENLMVTPVTDDRLLAIAYLRMHEEGILETVFHQGIPTVSSWLKGCLEPGKVMLGCFRVNPDQETSEFCGLGWVGCAEKMDGFKKAECGMCFFRKQSNRKQNVLFGKLMLAVFFDGYDVDVLFGATPEPNKLAMRYAQNLGFSMHGPVPNWATWRGQLVPAWISQLSKEEWRERGR
jgi:hypothetical protein